MNDIDENKKGNIKDLIKIMADLRTPETGCPWDLEQDFDSILPFTIEEVYEVADAIERKDFDDLKSELGDLLFQVVFYAQLASEEGRFDFSDIVNAICKKLVHRHPHVYDKNTIAKLKDGAEVLTQWEEIKKQERKDKSKSKINSLLDDIPTVLPELKRAQKIQTRVAKQGFDWDNIEDVWRKLDEESNEVKQAASENNPTKIEDEIGDLLFVGVNLARHYGFDAEQALRKANQKFEKRFREVEKLAGGDISTFSIDELELFWNKAKENTK